MIRCPRCDRLVVQEGYIHRCPDCGASLEVRSADPVALRQQARRLWWENRLTGPGPRRAFRSGVLWGAGLGAIAATLGSLEFGLSTLFMAVVGGIFGGLVAFLRLGHLSGMVVYGLGMIFFSGMFNPIAWIQFVASGAVIAFIAQDRRQGM